MRFNLEHLRVGTVYGSKEINWTILSIDREAQTFNEEKSTTGEVLSQNIKSFSYWNGLDLLKLGGLNLNNYIKRI